MSNISPKIEARRAPVPFLRTIGRSLASFGLAAVALSFLTGCEGKKEEPKPEPPEVEVVDVVQQNVPIFEEWVAQLNGPNNAIITPKVQGYLLKQNYQDGFLVRKGQLLCTKSTPVRFRLRCEQAKAQVAVAEANLSEANNNVARDGRWPLKTRSLRNNWTLTFPPRLQTWQEWRPESRWTSRTKPGMDEEFIRRSTVSQGSPMPR